MALSFIKSSGNIITEDFCMALANETKADYVKDKSFGAEMKKADEVIASTFEKLRERWEENRTQIIGNQLDNASLRKKWIVPFLESLGYQPVFVATKIKSESGTEYQIPYKGWDSEYAPLIHMVNTAQDFDTKDKHSRTHSNKSPQDCLQQFLNTSHHQWAILSNGKKVRLLRDFYHSITKGFLEFDLESIFETANSGQFRVLFRILHRSRIENQYQGKQEIEYDEEGNPIEVEDNCLLENFRKKSRETGVKVGNKLRHQVIEAIEKLGNGFAESLDPDEFQNGKVKAFYAEILNIIYRLLFLMFAEQKGWLPVRNSIYARTYSLNALREMAERGNFSHDEEHDLWEGLKITFKLVANGYKFKNGDETINAFGGQLFSDKKIAVIKDLSLKNKFLLDAIYRLSYFKLDNLSNRINYANLAIDELGSVYESLLDFEPKLAKDSFTLGKREIKRGEFYLDDRGTDRKTTGSYYTDSRLVAQLIESALVPVINNALKGKHTLEEKEQALLDLKVADIACGSGAFICAALEKMGEQLALIRMGDEERPTEDQLREAKRDVLLHCIYGVDLNPMALELAKFSLWITASLPDMPLTFLDHKLKCGNSLIGATPELIKKGIPEEAYKPVGNDNPTICTALRKKIKRELESLNRFNEPTSQYGLQFKRSETGELLRLREILNNRKQEQVNDVDLAEEEYRQLEKMERKFKDWLMADVWTSAFFIEKTELDLNLYPTNVTLENLRENQPVNEVLVNRVLKTADQYNFFHYHLEFPEVFEKGGFDCMLGNPPWEQVQLEEKAYFNGKIDLGGKKGNERKDIIQSLKTSNPILFAEYVNDLRNYNISNHFFENSTRFDLVTEGRNNTYSLFTYLAFQLINQYGIVGYIVPTGIATDYGNRFFFQFLIEGKKIINLIDFENRRSLFKDVEPNMRFTLLSISKFKNRKLTLAFGLIEPEQLNEPNRFYNLTPDEFFLFNPNTKTCPVFKSSFEANIAKKIYSYYPVLINDSTSVNPFDIQFKQGLFNMTSDSNYFLKKEELLSMGFTYDKNLFNKDGETCLPLYEAKFFGQHDARFASYEGITNRYGTKAGTYYPDAIQKMNPSYDIECRYWVNKNNVDSVIPEIWHHKWFIVFRDVIRPLADARCAIFSIIPYSAVGNTAPIVFFRNSKTENCLIAYSNFNSFVFDFLVRQKAGGAHLNFYILKQIPIIPFENYTKRINKEVVERVVKLNCTYEKLGVLNDILSNKFKITQWNDKERFQLQCELDAIYAHLYGLEKKEMDYILETFPIVKRKDIAKYGSYRTKETILQLYDEFAWVREEMAKTNEDSPVQKNPIRDGYV